MNVITNHHLKLAAALDHHDHPRVRLQGLGIGSAALFQFKTQPCGTVNQTHNILFAADVAENILRECFVFHAVFLDRV